MARISVKAVSLGIATDLVLTNLLMLPVISGILATPEMQALPAAAQTAAWLSVFTSASSPVYTIGLVLGSLASVCGGWVAAATARRDELRHGVLSALGCMAIGIYAWIDGTYEAAPAKHLAFLALSPALGLLGAAVRRRGVRRALERPPMQPAHPRTQKLVLGLDYLMITLCVFVAILFVTAGSIVTSNAPPFDAATFTVLAGYCLILFIAYTAAAHQLRTGHRFRWLAHVAAVALTLVPVLLAQ
jgi:hypothetical protein